MTKDDLIKLALIKLALESGLAKILDEHASEYRDGTFDRSEYPELLAFANLVAEHEREECAKLLDEMAAQDKHSNYYVVAAKALRTRSKS
jgi:hypothetical protein